MMQRGYPLNLMLDDKKCVVVGAGAEAATRAGNLLEAGARVLVVGEGPTPALSSLVSERLTLAQRRFHESDLDAAWLVVAVTPDAEEAARVAELCRERRIFFCAVDRPDISSYSHLALARAGSLTLAIGTDGRAPTLARRLREELARVLNESDAAREVERLASLRDATPSERRREVLADATREIQFEGALRFRK